MPKQLNDKYQIEATLGEGAMGRVYLAIDLEQQRKVAIKQIIVPDKERADRDELIERFKREYLFLSDIDHPGVVKAYDFFDRDGDIFMALEYIDGICLRDYIIQKPQKLSFTAQLALAIQLARAIEVINTAGIIHRDIKPGNVVFVEKQCIAKLLDLGIAKSLKDELCKLTKTGSIIGTPGFMSPEQVDGEVCANSDVFSLGVLLYQFFSWLPHSPFAAHNVVSTMMMITTKQLPPLTEQIDFPLHKNKEPFYRQLSQVLAMAMAKEAQERTATAKELADQLTIIYQDYRRTKKKPSTKLWIPDSLNTQTIESLQKLGKKYGRDFTLRNLRKTGRITQRRLKKTRQTSAKTAQIWGIAGGILLLLVVLSFFSFSPQETYETPQRESLRQDPTSSEMSNRVVENDENITRLHKERQQEALARDKWRQITSADPFLRWQQIHQFIAEFGTTRLAQKAQQERLKIVRIMTQRLQQIIDKATLVSEQNFAGWKEITQSSFAAAQYQSVLANIASQDENFAELLEKFQQRYSQLREIRAKALAHQDKRRRQQRDLQQQRAQMQQTWRQVQEEVGALTQLRRFSVAREQLQKMKNLAESLALRDTAEQIHLALEELDHLQNFLGRLREIAEKARARNEKMSISLRDGKLIRGDVVEIEKKHCSLRDYKGQLHRVEYLEVRAKQRFFLSSTRNKRDMLCLGILLYYEDEWELAEKFLQKGKMARGDFFLGKIAAIKSELARRKIALDIISPKYMVGQRNAAVEAEVWELSLTGAVSGIEEPKIFVNDVESNSWQAKNRRFTVPIPLQYGKNKVNLRVVCGGETFRKSWTITRQIPQNLPVYLGSLARTNHYITQGVRKLRGLKWKFRAGSSVHTSPVVADGKVLAGNDSGRFYAINSRTGKQEWMFKAEDQVRSSAAVDRGTVYFGSDDKCLYALHLRTGKLKWKIASAGKIRTAPLIVSDIVYFTSFDKNLYAADVVTGRILWKFATDEKIYSSPAVSKGVLYFGCNKSVYAVAVPTGREIWKFSDNREFRATPAVLGNFLYITNIDGMFYAINNRTGSLQWKWKTADINSTGAAIANGIAYIGNENKQILALEIDSGKLLWDFKAGSRISAIPTVADGIVYCTCYDHYLYAVDARTGKMLWRYETEKEILYSSPFVANGVVYFGGDDGYIYALH